jgi:hypothetical protein
MFRILKFVFRLVKKKRIFFKLPAKVNLVVFDKTSLNDLKIVLKNIKYFVIANRPSDITEIYITLPVLIRFLANCRHLCAHFNSLKIQDLYFLSLIEAIKPKKVFTFIDYSLQFSIISKLANKKIQFVALQQGPRYTWAEVSYLFKKNFIKKNLNKKLYISHLLCWGNYDKFFAKKNKVAVKKFTAVGSLRLANFLSGFKFIKRKKKYDVCLLSEYGAWFNKYNNINFNNIIDLEAAYIKLVKYIIKFSTNNNLKFVLALKRRRSNINNEDYINEQKWFKEKFSNVEYKFLKKNFLYNSSGSSYKASFNSEVTIGVYSTLLTETLCSGNKILSCNLAKPVMHSFPLNGVCKIDNCNFKNFEARMKLVLRTTKLNYFKKIKSDYLMPTFFNPNTTYNKIRNIII